MEGQLRIGRVTDVAAEIFCVRVVFPDSGLVSGWLSVIRRADEWLPAIDDTVLCIYGHSFNADGFVLGVIS